MRGGEEEEEEEEMRACVRREDMRMKGRFVGIGRR